MPAKVKRREDCTRRMSASAPATSGTPVRFMPMSMSTSTVSFLPLPSRAALERRDVRRIVDGDHEPWLLPTRSRQSSSILTAPTTGVVSSTPGIPASTITVASRKVATEMPTAPAAICRLAISTLL